MNKWKNLEIDNLPPDILTGGYEFSNAGNDRIVGTNIIEILEYSLRGTSFTYDYRKPEPKQPTHEQIMKPKYWQCDNPDYWRMITGFRISNIDGVNQYLIYDGWCNSDYFIGRESANLPTQDNS